MLLASKSLFRLINFAILLLAGLMFSCSQEYKIAKAYTRQFPKGSILLMRPDFIYKTNQMRFDLSDKMSENEKDSVSFFRSAYVQYIDDSAFLQGYISNMVDRLLADGFDVYDQEYTDSFMNAAPPAYIVNIAQLQLEESHDSVFETTGETDSEGTYNYQGIRINTVHLNSWIEVTELNADSGKVKKMFYASSRARDGISSRLNFISSGELRFTYVIDSLRLSDIYDLATKSGKTYGDYLFDYFMNENIRKSLLPWISQEYDMHYDPDKNRVKISNGEGFQEIKGEK
jgi:hypothetical protein